MRTDTGLKDSYTQPIYEGDAIYDEVGGFFSYIVKYKGEWYAAHNPDGDVLNGPLVGTVKRRCRVIHADAESVVELWQRNGMLLEACQDAIAACVALVQSQENGQQPDYALRAARRAIEKWDDLNRAKR